MTNKDEYKNKVESVTLPQWLIDADPEPQEPVFIDYDENNNMYVVKIPDHDSIFSFSSVEEAFDYAESKYRSLSFTDALREKESDNMIGNNSMTVPSEKGFTRLLMAIPDSYKVSRLKDEYYHWQHDVCQPYLDDSSDFMKSYAFLNNHPCFWLKFLDFNWQSYDHVQNITVRPYYSDDEKVRYSVEMGAHVSPNYSEHYYDFRLDVVEASSFESAIIDAAALIHKFFDTDGNQRENVEYEKSDYQLYVEEKIREAEEELDNEQ